VWGPVLLALGIGGLAAFAATVGRRGPWQLFLYFGIGMTLAGVARLALFRRLRSGGIQIARDGVRRHGESPARQVPWTHVLGIEFSSDGAPFRLEPPEAPLRVSVSSKNFVALRPLVEALAPRAGLDDKVG
jgi:hypothetical protein